MAPRFGIWIALWKLPANWSSSNSIRRMGNTSSGTRRPIFSVRPWSASMVDTCVPALRSKVAFITTCLWRAGKRRGWACARAFLPVYGGEGWRRKIVYVCFWWFYRLGHWAELYFLPRNWAKKCLRSLRSIRAEISEIRVFCCWCIRYSALLFLILFPFPGSLATPSCFCLSAFVVQFLDAPSHLYMRLCPSVRRSVDPSVRPSVR